MLLISIEWWWLGYCLTMLQLTTYGLPVKYWILSIQSKNPYNKMNTKISLTIFTLFVIGSWNSIAGREMNTLVINKWKLLIQQQHIKPNLVLSKIDATVGGKKSLHWKMVWKQVRVELLDGIKIWWHVDLNQSPSIWKQHCIICGSQRVLLLTALQKYKLYAWVDGGNKDDDLNGKHINTSNLQKWINTIQGDSRYMWSWTVCIWVILWHRLDITNSTWI